MNRRNFIKNTAITAFSFLTGCSIQKPNQIPKTNNPSLEQLIHRKDIRKKSPTLILAAMPQELKYHEKVLQNKILEGEDFISGTINDRKVVLGLTGIGTDMAAAITKYAIFRFSPSAIIFTGVGGSLDKNVGMGDVGIIEASVNYQTDLRGFDKSKYLLGQQLFQEESTRISRADPSLINLAWNFVNKKGVSSEFFRGYSATGDQFLISDSPTWPENLKHLTKQHFNKYVSHLLYDKDGLGTPNCCDMETDAIMKQANNAKIPVIAFRQISDTLNGDAVNEFNESVLKKGIEKYGSVVEYLINNI